MPTTPRVNGPAYSTAYFFTRYLNVPPNLHRLKNAVGLTVGLYLGRKMMDIIVGQTIDGKPIDKKELPLPLQPLCGILPYDHFSDDPKERWMKVFDMTVPAVMGGLGASAGSLMFFKESFINPTVAKMHLPAEKVMLADAERRALYHISRPWSLMSGVSAIFGSASGFGLFPSPVNYSSTLGTLFTIRSERAMANPLIRKYFNAHSPYPFRPTKLVDRMIEYAAGNPDANPARLEGYARGIIQTWFKHADEKQIKAFADEVLRQRNQFLKDGHLPQEAEAQVKKHLKKTFNDVGVEKTFIKIGLDPREAAIGDMGFISSIAHFMGDVLGMGTSRHVERTQYTLRQGLEARHPELKKIPFIPKPPHYNDGAGKRIATAAFLGTGVAAAGAIATTKDTGLCDLDPEIGATPVHNAADHHPSPNMQKNPLSHTVHSKKRHGFINGAALDTIEGITSLFQASVGMHRIHCAIGLTAGSMLGDKVMEALTGVTFHGSRIEKEKVWKPLQKIYGVMAYQPKSDHPHDRWMQVLRWGVPAAVGALGVVEGSKMFFSKRHEELKKAKYLDEIEDRATDAQSQSWSYTSAFTALMGYPSGLPMSPFANYSTNLGTRFSMASGRKVSLPIVGKYWSNNSTLFPFGPPGMLNLLIQESVNNKSFDPELLETYAIGVLKPWFKNVTPEQITAFVLKVHEVRDRFYQEGGVPAELKTQLEAELKAHFKGAGLEETLTEIGLNPLDAEIASNGWSGAIANKLGAKHRLDKIKADYVKSYREREQKRHQTPSPGDKDISF